MTRIAGLLVLALALSLGAAGASEIAPGTKAPPDPNACADSLVWRLARPDDRVCVPPQAHDRTMQENKDAALNVDPKGAWGPNSCKTGYVWREAFAGDLVCVTPEVRSIVREENVLGPSRLFASQTTVKDLIDLPDSDEPPALVPTGPWLCGEENIDAVVKTRTGNVIDRQGRVWRYGLNGRGSATPAYRWQVKDSAVATAEELNKRYAAATTTGKSLAVEDVTAHLPLIEEAAKTEATATGQHDAMTSGTSRLYCLMEDKAAGGYREVVLEQRGALVRINPSPAARKLKLWFQSSFWIID